MYIRQISLVFLLLFLGSCAEQDLFNSGQVPQYVLDSSVQLFEGDIIAKSTDTLEGVDVWSVKLQKNSGAELTIYWQRKNNIIFRLIGNKGPFDYELKPPLNVLVLSTAKFLAFESYSKEILESWQLLRDSNQNLQWVYRFYLQGQQAPISINAVSGDIL